MLPALGAYLASFWGRVGAEEFYSIPRHKGSLQCSQRDLGGGRPACWATWNIRVPKQFYE